MGTLFYSTGQVARQLSTTVATVRTLCENRLIAAETTPGGQWRVSASELARLKRDGLPPIPRQLPNARTSSTRDGPADRGDPPPSVEVVHAADEVAITKCLLEKRKIDRELEETEDWFRSRARQQEAAEAAQRQRAAAADAAQQRWLWEQKWLQYALDSVPYDARREVELEVHAEVREALSELQPWQPMVVVQRLVDAAVHRALGPWNRKQDIERSLRAGMSALPWDVQYRSEQAALKQRAWEAAVAAVGKVRAEARYGEMETAAVQAVQPMIREYQQQQACQHIVNGVHIFWATREEDEAATQAVRKALAALPIGVNPSELQQAADKAEAPYRAAVAQRTEREAKRRELGWKVDNHLSHIERYLEEEYKFTGGCWERFRERDRLRPLIREALIDELLEYPDMSDEEIRESIEEQIDEEL
jgi:hypothetical protein